MLYLMAASPRRVAPEMLKLLPRPEAMTAPLFPKQVQAVEQELRQLDVKRAAKQLGVDSDWVKLTKEYIAQAQSAPPVPAHALYETPIFGSVGFGEMEDYEIDATNDRIRILDPYLGLARPFDRVAPGAPEMRWEMKFSFGSKLTPMSEFWREHVKNGLTEALLDNGAEYILNCGVPDAQIKWLESIDALPAPVIDVVWRGFRAPDVEERMTGELLRWCLFEGVIDPEELETYEATYDPERKEVGQARVEYDAELSKGMTYVYNPAIMEFKTLKAQKEALGLTNKEFKKMFMSKDARYLRTDFKMEQKQENLRKKGKWDV